MRFFKRDEAPPPSNGGASPSSSTPPQHAPRGISSLDPRNALARALHGSGGSENEGSKQGATAPKPVKTKSEPKKGDSKPLMYHWEKEVGGGKKSSADDMVLLTKINETAITDNLKRRFHEDKIYTYIGPVLVAVNPFKQLSCFGEKEIRLYQGAAQYEVPPHIYALADNMYRNMLIDGESQCVIISGESGAGKTVSAKFIMNYMTQISSGGSRLQHVKDIILSSNPLLEAFGNAKTNRNNNSSRFGKYIEIQFSRGGEPLGGNVSNFLLEKSRVHSIGPGERNFHIFYQLIAGASPEMQKNLGVAYGQPDYYHYLKHGDIKGVEGVDDAEDFKETLQAMSVMGLDGDQQNDILRVVAAIMHLSNVSFLENNNDAVVEEDEFLQFPSFLMGIPEESLKMKLVSRVMETFWGGKTDRVEVTFNQEKAQFARDAWAKGLYSRLFEFIVQIVNKSLATNAKDLNIGILDIYGFEIFETNGFEQFCINYVNEKLQQIFIELTLKNEQEEYASEGIEWTPIQFFNNAIVCQLIESRSPVGIMCVLDDTCAKMSAVSQGADDGFKTGTDSLMKSHAHYQPFKNGFTIKHYAGAVSYHVDGFCEKNRDVLNVDIIEVMQTSNNAFIRSLFPDKIAEMSRGRPTTAGSKIKTQANVLVSTLTQCVPHYIRCIKPNETKRPRDWEQDMVKHQVEYLGLKENIKVKRAGFAYRRPFNKFLARYAILTRETWPKYRGPPVEGVHAIMKSANMDQTHYQIGKTKVFIKDPESLYMLEECRERKFDHYARVIQKAFKKHFSKRRELSEKEAASKLVFNLKERRRYSLHRAFHGDYLDVPKKTGLMALVPKREKILFALTVEKFDRQFRQQKRDLIVTSTTLLLIGREKMKEGPEKGTWKEVEKRRIQLQDITEVWLSKWQDDFMLLCVNNDYSSLLQVRLKTELLLVLHRAMQDLGSKLHLRFDNSMDYKVRGTGWGGGKARKVIFTSDGQTDDAILVKSGNSLTVKITRGMSANARPSSAYVDNEVKEISQKCKTGELRSVRGSRLVPTNQQSFMNNNNINPSQANGRAAINQPTSIESNNSTKNKRGFRVPKKNFGKSVYIPPPPPDDPAPPGQPNITQDRRKLPPKPAPPPVPKKPQVRALYAYDARDVDELSFDVNDILLLIEEDQSGWWTCEINGKKGYCPGNYVEKM